MGVSAQSIYNWERKKAAPRKEQLAALVAFRSLGKREVSARPKAQKAILARTPPQVLTQSIQCVSS